MKKLLFLILLVVSSALAIGQTTGSTQANNIIIKNTAPYLHLNGMGAMLNFYNGDIKLIRSALGVLSLTGGILKIGSDTASTQAYARTYGTSSSPTFTGVIKAKGGIIMTAKSAAADKVDSMKVATDNIQFYHGSDTLIPYIPVAGQTDISDIILLKHLVINPQTGSNYTLVLTDDGKFITINHADADTLIIPENGTVAFPVGTQITVQGIGAGLTFFKPYSGTVILTSPDNKVTQRVQYSVVTLLKRAENTWSLIGDLK